jgi:XTP/dITP diphosphohydrolase
VNESPVDRLLLASNNQHKLTEFRRIMNIPGLEIMGPQDLGIRLEVEETGDTMAVNARLKALAFSAETGLAVVADDSGLEVDALDGAPGVRSNRFEGLGNDAARNSRLLEMLDGVPVDRRTARFRCVVVLAREGTVLFEGEATCDGSIAAQTSGPYGFGYDPLFVPDGYSQTFGELGADVKDRISHRGRAIAALREHLTSGAVPGD